MSLILFAGFSRQRGVDGMYEGWGSGDCLCDGLGCVHKSLQSWEDHLAAVAKSNYDACGWDASFYCICRSYCDVGCTALKADSSGTYNIELGEKIIGESEEFVISS